MPNCGLLLTEEVVVIVEVLAVNSGIVLLVGYRERWFVVPTFVFLLTPLIFFITFFEISPARNFPKHKGFGISKRVAIVVGCEGIVLLRLGWWRGRWEATL